MISNIDERKKTYEYEELAVKTPAKGFAKVIARCYGLITLKFPELGVYVVAIHVVAAVILATLSLQMIMLRYAKHIELRDIT